MSYTFEPLPFIIFHERSEKLAFIIAISCGKLKQFKCILYMFRRQQRNRQNFVVYFYRFLVTFQLIKEIAECSTFSSNGLTIMEPTCIHFRIGVNGPYGIPHATLVVSHEAGWVQREDVCFDVFERCNVCSFRFFLHQNENEWVHL